MATVFVTVGSTSFDDLIVEVNKPDFHHCLLKLGYRHLIVQYGSGLNVPKLPDSSHTLSLTAFRFKDSLDDDFNCSSLVISHAGAGTCMQALTPTGRRKLLVVVNTSLMGNHQKELAHVLSEKKHALVSTPSLLINLLKTGKRSYANDELSLCQLQTLIGPSTTPEEAGFIGFVRGDPKRLLYYLDSYF